MNEKDGVFRRAVTRELLGGLLGTLREAENAGLPLVGMDSIVLYSEGCPLPVWERRT